MNQVNSTPIPMLRCPACHGDLSTTQTAYRCESCAEVLPITPQGAAIAVAGAVEYLQATARHLELERSKLDALCLALDGAAKQAGWRAGLGALIKALHSRKEFGDLELGDIKQTLTGLGVEMLTPTSAGTSWGFGFSDFLYYDWSAQSFAAAQRNQLLERVVDAVKTAAPACVSPLLVGGGAGRHFFDLAKHLPSLVGCDLDYTYVDTYHRLLKGPVELHDVHAPMIGGESLVSSELCHMPAERPKNVQQYFVADATRLPFAAGALDCVISIYMTDCVPLPALLSEMRRVLCTGGAFVSSGPLIYRGVDPAHWYTPAEVMKLSQDFGFRCEQESWMELPYWNSPDKGARRTHRVWTYVLRKSERQGM